MLYLKTPLQEDLLQYSTALENKIHLAATHSTINQQTKDFLSISKIKEILIDTPNNLINHHSEFMDILIPNFEPDGYSEYFNIKKIKVSKRTADQTQIFDKYNEANKVAKIFNYEKYISGSKSTSYDLARKLNRNTCTYCNRLYTNTIIKKNVKNNSGKITRPQFDHWFAKSIYPVLSLSFYNLIPSCYVCNSSIKGDAKFSLSSHINPYLKEDEQNFTFSFYFKNLEENNVKIISPSNSKIANTLKEFKILEVYNAHSHLELKDILDLKYKYSQNYLNTLFNDSFKNLKISKKEAYRLIFGVEHDEDDFYKRPFSKFKKDVLKELDVID